MSDKIDNEVAAEIRAGLEWAKVDGPAPHPEAPAAATRALGILGDIVDFDSLATVDPDQVKQLLAELDRFCQARGIDEDDSFERTLVRVLKRILEEMS